MKILACLPYFLCASASGYLFRKPTELYGSVCRHTGKASTPLRKQLEMRKDGLVNTRDGTNKMVNISMISPLLHREERITTLPEGGGATHLDEMCLSFGKMKSRLFGRVPQETASVLGVILTRIRP